VIATGVFRVFLNVAVIEPLVTPTTSLGKDNDDGVRVG
jgi:hypothetical protein